MPRKKKKQGDLKKKTQISYSLLWKNLHFFNITLLFNKLPNNDTEQNKITSCIVSANLFINRISHYFRADTFIKEQYTQRLIKSNLLTTNLKMSLRDATAKSQRTSLARGWRRQQLIKLSDLDVS